MSEETQACARFEALVAEVKKGIKPGMDEKVQEEIGQLLGLLPYLKQSEYSHLIGVAEVAVTALLSEQPNLKLATEVRQRLSYRVRPLRNPLVAVIRGGTPPTRVILGLGILLYFAIPMSFIYLPRILDQKTIVGIETDYLLMVALAGAVGSIVSIMVRIQDFSVYVTWTRRFSFLRAFLNQWWALLLLYSSLPFSVLVSFLLRSTKVVKGTSSSRYPSWRGLVSDSQKIS